MKIVDGVRGAGGTGPDLNVRDGLHAAMQVNHFEEDGSKLPVTKCRCEWIILIVILTRNN